MKKIVLGLILGIISLGILISFTSCDDDDSNKPNNTKVADEC